MARVMQAIGKSTRRLARMRAAANLHETVVDPNGHALVEDEAFAQPMLVSELLLVTDNPAVELKDIFKASRAE